MKNGTLRLLLLGIFAAGAFSCSNDAFDIGNGWVTVSTRTMVIDTCTLELTTLMVDSVSTQASGLLFAGQTSDPYFGQTTASSYLTFELTGDYTYKEPNDFSTPIIKFDSLTLVLRDTVEYRGDTTLMQTLQVCRLLERVEVVDDEALYTSASFRYDPDPVAVHSWRSRPHSPQEVEIRLPDDIGKDILDRLNSQDESVSTSDYFAKYFNGLVLMPGDNSRLVSSFSASDSTCMMRLYYRTVGDLEEFYELNFKLNTQLYFSRFVHDRSGSVLNELSRNNNEIPSSSTQHTSFIQGLSGIYTRIELPHLNRIMELGSHGYIVAGTLQIYPVKDSYSDGQTPLPEKLYLYESDETNTTTGSITDNSGDMQTGYLTVDDIYKENTAYTFDVTSFLQSQLGKFGIYKKYLQVSVPDYNATLSTLVMGDQQHPDQKVVLTLTYTVYDE